MPAIILDLLSGVGALELVWFWPARQALAPQVDLPSEVIEFPTATTLTLASKTILSPNLSPIEVNYVLLFLPLAVLLPLIIIWTHIVIKSGRLTDVARALRCTLAGPATNITVVLTLVLSQPIYWQRWVSSCALGTASDALHVDALIVVLSLSCGLAQLSTQRTHRFYDGLLLIALSVIHGLTLPTTLSASTVTLLFGLTLVSADLNAGCDLVVTQGLLRTVDALGVAAPGPRAVRSSSLFTTVRRTLLSFRVPLAKMRFVMSWSAAPLNRKYTDEIAPRFHREILSTIRKIQQRRIRTGSARKLQPIALVNDAAPPCVTSASRDSDISPAPIFSSKRELTGTSQFFEDDSDSDDGSETVTYERLRNRTDDIDASEHAAWDEWYKSGAAVPDAIRLDTLGVSSAYDGRSRDAARVDHPVVHGRARYVDATGKVVSARRDLDCETVPYKRLPVRRRALPARRSKSGDTGESFRSNWSQLGSGP